MQIAFALYPKFTMLDVVGPIQVLADAPGRDVLFVAAQEGPNVAIEYDPEPPHEAGSPAKAPPEIVESVHAVISVVSAAGTTASTGAQP
jgi:hypothetical protein